MKKQMPRFNIYFYLILILFASLTSFKYKSYEGKGLSPYSQYRALNIFINIIYDLTPEANPKTSKNSSWSYTGEEGVNNNLPDFLDAFIDNSYHNPDSLNGLMTKLYHESSFGRLVVLGDNIVLNIKQSRIEPTGKPFGYGKLMRASLDMIEEYGGLDSCVIGGLRPATEYDTDNNKKLDFVQIMLRNASSEYGKYYAGIGFASGNYNANIKIDGREYDFQKYSVQGIGDNDLSKSYKSGIFHEFSHMLFGGNNFHTSGGNHYGSGNLTVTFMGRQGGYGLMGGGNSGLTSCNGYDRWRMRWTSETYNPEGILIQANGNNSDVSKENGSKIFYLRDFVSTGDAIRIKLPYKDSGFASNQYIWLENHQINRNGKIDFNRLAYTGCVPDGTAGVYAYYQVGKDVLESDNYRDVWPNNETDNLRFISAEGNHDMSFHGKMQDCLGWGKRDILMYEAKNPFCGVNDLNPVFITETTDILKGNRRDDRQMGVKKLDSAKFDRALPWLGDNYDAFTDSSVIDISTNPAAVNTLTYYVKQPRGNIKAVDLHRNTRKIYLSGLSIKMFEDGEEENGKIFRVEIRWDDYAVKNNVRWTGNIALNEKCLVQPDKKILLTQNRTAIQHIRDPQTGEFSPATVFTSYPGSEFVLENGASLELEEGSYFILKSGSNFRMDENAELRINAGCSFIIEPGAEIDIDRGAKIMVERGAVVQGDEKIVSKILN